MTADEHKDNVDGYFRQEHLSPPGSRMFFSVIFTAILCPGSKKSSFARDRRSVQLSGLPTTATNSNNSVRI
jgi:hypothetical protein